MAALVLAALACQTAPSERPSATPAADAPRERPREPTQAAPRGHEVAPSDAHERTGDAAQDEASRDVTSLEVAPPGVALDERADASATPRERAPADAPSSAALEGAPADPPSPALEPAPASCCKRCGPTSQPCGDSCISRSKRCHKGPGCACSITTPPDAGD